MKRILTYLIFALFTYSLSAQNFTFEQAGVKGVTIGVMMLKGDTWIIREGQGNAVIDYYPINLTDEYKLEGQEVVFEAILGKIPNNVRLVGKPVQLTMIRKLYRANPKEATDEMSVQKEAAEVKISNVQGLMIKISDTWLIESVTDGKTMRYVPENLPEDFKVEGMEVTVTGMVGKNDPSVRAMGEPLRIIEMTAIEKTKIQTQNIQAAMKDFYPFEPVGRVDAKEGIIKKFSSDPDTYIFETDNGTRRYLPAYIPEEFLVHNKKVRVSGTFGNVPANVRMAGTPFEIEVIEEME
jgi:hypothetical protein